jgi:predicted SprT family Zn-dependent metalloprotease
LVAYLPEERGAMMKTLHVDWQLIMVNDMIMNKLNPEDKQYVIAHELARVYLKHEHNPFNEKNKDFEQEADDLVRSWGSTQHQLSL